MEEIIGLIVVVIIFMLGVIVLIKESKEFEEEEKIREIQLQSIKGQLEYHKKMCFYQEDDTNYEIGEWEKEVRQDMHSIVKITDLYKTNKKVNVLVGDYNISSVSNTVSILESMGINTKIAKSGIEIIKRIKNGEMYDLIITNNIYDRGHCDGPQMLDRLRELDNFNTPVVVLTVSEGKRHFFIGELGFDEYMTKLLTQEKILDTLPKIIDNLKFTKIAKKKESNKS